MICKLCGGTLVPMFDGYVWMHTWEVEAKTLELETDAA